MPSLFSDNSRKIFGNKEVQRVFDKEHISHTTHYWPTQGLLPEIIASLEGCAAAGVSGAGTSAILTAAGVVGSFVIWPATAVALIGLVAPSARLAYIKNKRETNAVGMESRVTHAIDVLDAIKSIETTIELQAAHAKVSAILDAIKLELNKTKPSSQTSKDLKKLLNSDAPNDTKIKGIKAVLKIAKKHKDMRGRKSIKLIIDELGNTYTAKQCVTLKSASIRSLIANGTITIDRALALAHLERTNLESMHIRRLINLGTIDLDRALALTDLERTNLEYIHIRRLINHGTITLDQALVLTGHELEILNDKAIRDLIVGGFIDLDRALTLTRHQVFILTFEVIRDLITDNIITLDQAIALNNGEFTRLLNPETRQGLRVTTLTFEQFMRQAAAPVAPIINDTQSTHTASVNNSVSESATKLYESYKSHIDGDKLDTVIEEVKTYVNKLADKKTHPDNNKYQAAKRCVERITAHDYAHTDRTSNITTKQLLALAFLATGDGDKRIGDLEDARTQFVEGLYEIQRGYNLSESGVDDCKKKDSSICSAGTFNKLIEKLQGIHPDCEVKTITKQIASLTLQGVVRQEAMQHLIYLVNNLKTAADYKEFDELMKTVKEDGVEVIFDDIKGRVADRMFEEYGTLYPDRATSRPFKDLIDAGVYTELAGVHTELSKFQEEVQREEVQREEGYRQYCSQTLKQSGMFFPHNISAKYLSDHRHCNQECQKKYDESFGIVPYVAQ